MKTNDALKIFFDKLEDNDVALFTTGFTSRFAFNVKERPANFYMIGSMGLLSSVGLGIALNSKKRVFIFEGDGSLLMDMGTMAMIAKHKPQNLFHIVLDNKSYESTGGQKTISSDIDFSKVAENLGYNEVYKIYNSKDLENEISDIVDSTGPVFIHLEIKNDPDSHVGRVSIDPDKLTERLKKELKAK